MPWPCRLIDKDADNGDRPGDMWFVTSAEGKSRHELAEEGYSQHYLDHHFGERLPIRVRLPNGLAFCPDRTATTGSAGWTVEGEPPDITVSPSIDAVGAKRYHGWLRDGVLSDDLDGRTYG